MSKDQGSTSGLQELHLYTDHSAPSTAALLLASIAHKSIHRHSAEEAQHLSPSQFPVLQVDNAKDVTCGFPNVAQQLCSSKETQHLLGTDEEEKKLLAEWFNWSIPDTSAGFDKQKHMGSLNKLNRILLSQAFLINNHVTAADLLVFSAILPLMPAIDTHTKYTLAGVSRWFDLLQHQPHFASVLPSRVDFDLNYPFNPKPPQAKDKKAEADKAKEGQTNNQQPQPQQPKQPKQQQQPSTSSAAGGASSSGSSSAPHPEQQQKQQKQPHQQGQGQGQDKGKQPQQPRQPKQPKKAAGSDTPDIARLDIRVGRIQKVSKHPDANTLYVEEIDLGDPAPRIVVSGLVEHVPESEMLNARVVCLCNLKPQKMRGVMSHAMVLCASTPGKAKVELLHPPDNARIGEQVTFEGYPGQPDKQLNPKKKIFETVQPNFTTGEDLVAYWRDETGKLVPFMTSDGPVKASSVVGGSIS